MVADPPVPVWAAVAAAGWSLLVGFACGRIWEIRQQWRRAQRLRAQLSTTRERELRKLAERLHRKGVRP